MKTETFNQLVEEIRAASVDTLMAKNAKYAAGDDLRKISATEYWDDRARPVQFGRMPG